ncbi:MAG: hypothetical protein ACR2MG_01225 [Pyrinomonadaceae bacterium]
MTDNQFTQLFDLVTKSVTGVQRLEKDVAELKQGQARLETDVAELKSELKQGQMRMEKEMQITNKLLKIQQSDVMTFRARLEILEDEKEMAS